MILSLNWGLIPYELALSEQIKLVESVSKNPDSEYLVFCSHPSVVTLGRGTKPEDIQDYSGDIFEVQRGGRATYHGPEQVICYPILHLQNRQLDLHKYLRLLEEAIVRSLTYYGITASGKKDDATGVWVNDKKIASIGIAAKKWVSYHGLAVNVNKDDLAFKGISPCGFSQSTMVSLEELKGHPINKDEYKENLKEELIALLNTSWN